MNQHNASFFPVTRHNIDSLLQRPHSQDGKKTFLVAPTTPHLRRGYKGFHQNARLLVVEDGEKAVRIVTLGLKAEKCAVDERCDGRTGPGISSEIPYRVIVDLILPELSGTDLISWLQQHKLPVPILILTAGDALDDKVTNFEAGADDGLTKPFAFAELLTRVKALLKQGSADQPNCFCVGGLEIDRISHQVRRNGITIKLTAKEYALL